MRCPNPPLTTPVSILLHRLYADCSSHLDSWHGRQDLSNRHRPDEQHLRDVAAPLYHFANVCLQGCVPHRQARLTPRQTTANTSLYCIMGPRGVPFHCPRYRTFRLDGHHSISHRRPTHVAAVAFSRPNLLQRHSGPPRFQLTMLWMKTTRFRLFRWTLDSGFVTK